MIDLTGLKWKENYDGDIYKYEVLELTDRESSFGSLYLIKCNYWWTNTPEEILMPEEEIANKILMSVFYNLIKQQRAPSNDEVKLMKSLNPSFFNAYDE